MHNIELRRFTFLFCFHYFCNSDLHQLKIPKGNLFASSIAKGSEPSLAIDDDFENGKETCFESSLNQFDFDGFHWLVVDLGTTTENITEIRISPGKRNLTQGNTNEVDVFVTRRLYTTSIFQPNPSFGSLPWEKYIYCNNTKNELLTDNEAVVNCFPARTGRWILLRKKPPPFFICHLIVQADIDENDCFEPIEQTDNIVIGSQFGQMRHVSEEQCRRSCAETPVCQAFQFVSQLRTRKCRLFQDSFDGSSDNQSVVVCPAASKCLLEKNLCHRGGMLQLTPDPTGNHFFWKIENTNPGVQVSDVYAVQLEGRLRCLDVDCGLLKVYILDERDDEYLCGVLDTEQLSLLDKETIDCTEQESAGTRPKAVKISHILRDDLTSPAEPLDFTINIEGGYIRFSKSKVSRTWLIRKAERKQAQQLYDEKQKIRTDVSSTEDSPEEACITSSELLTTTPTRSPEKGDVMLKESRQSSSLMDSPLSGTKREAYEGLMHASLIEENVKGSASIEKTTSVACVNNISLRQLMFVFFAVNRIF